MEKLLRPFGGPLTIYRVDEQTKLWAPQLVLPHNLILFEGSDILGRVLAGQGEYAVGTMYFEFTNGAVPAVVPLRDEGQSYYDGLSIGSSDLIRATIDSTPIVKASGGDFNSNIAEFISLTFGAIGVHGTTFSQAAGSKVYGGALVASPDGLFSGDLVFARFYFTEQDKLDGSQIGIKWPVKFP